jgi:hypothetical protein
MSTLKKWTCKTLIVSMFALSFQAASAGMIGAEQAAPETERGLVLAALDRADVVQQLQAAGVEPQAARERVASMSEAEVRALAQDIQTAPAGALDTAGWVAVIAVAALVWYFAIRK